MNCWLNPEGDWDQAVFGLKPLYRTIRRVSDMIDPGPSQTFVFLDEREDCINDGYFALSMGRKGPLAAFSDVPASYHSGAGNFSFADGHGEVHRWLDPRTKPPLRKRDLRNFASPHNPDIHWLQEHATGLK
jgi:prepilin-type processing-associated H-X9-DG protein